MLHQSLAIYPALHKYVQKISTYAVVPQRSTLSLDMFSYIGFLELEICYRITLKMKGIFGVIFSFQISSHHLWCR